MENLILYDKNIMWMPVFFAHNDHWLFARFTSRNSSCGKVMFSQACVSHFVQGGVLSLAGLGGAILSRGYPSG